jgi:cardiolipin synthase
MPFTRGNSAKLLIDGENTFSAIFDAIDGAKDYVLVQFYIARGDALGQKLAEILKRKSAQGVACYYLYDEMGSRGTISGYWTDLASSGVKISRFDTKRGGWRNRFQINFRNHRKVVVVDGKEAFVGGHNIGVDYLGKGPLGPWRDTHVAVKGPVVAAIQMTFVEDWFWSQNEVPDLNWSIPAENPGPLAGLCLPTGPADDFDTCALMFSQIIQSARHRLWISTPYFVPDSQVLSHLKLAALRGVDVRILLPDKPDTFLPYLASYTFIELAEETGVQFYRYNAGFPHQKVVMIDDYGVAIGTANIDNRSFRLNFEISLLFAGEPLASETAAMLEKDFSLSSRVPVGSLRKKPLVFQLGVRVARLFAPIL